MYEPNCAVLSADFFSDPSWLHRKQMTIDFFALGIYCTQTLIFSEGHWTVLSFRTLLHQISQYPPKHLHLSRYAYILQFVAHLSQHVPGTGGSRSRGGSLPPRCGPRIRPRCRSWCHCGSTKTQATWKHHALEAASQPWNPISSCLTAWHSAGQSHQSLQDLPCAGVQDGETFRLAPQWPLEITKRKSRQT